MYNNIEKYKNKYRAIDAVEPNAMQYSDKVECSALDAMDFGAMQHSDRLQCSGCSGAQRNAMNAVESRVVQY